MEEYCHRLQWSHEYMHIYLGLQCLFVHLSTISKFRLFLMMSPVNVMVHLTSYFLYLQKNRANAVTGDSSHNR